MNFELIKYTTEDATSLIEINRPQVYNALNTQGKMEIISALKQSEKDPRVKSVVITGLGKAFCTGQDLNDRTVQGETGSVDLGHTLETEWNPLVESLRSCRKIVIAALNGVAAGAGVSVALSADLLIAHPSVKFVSGFSKLGLTPDAGSSFTFTQAMGPRRALEFFLFNEPLNAEELLQYGLINKIDDAPLELAKNWAKKIASLAPLSVEVIKKNTQLALEHSFKDSMGRETAAQRFLGSTLDYQEGLKAFFEKRSPTFKGQ